MQPGSNPDPFNPTQFQPSENKVKRSHLTVLIVVLIVLVVGGGWLLVSKVKHVVGLYHDRKHEVLEGNYGEKRFDTTYAQPFDPSIQTAKLIINGGTCTYAINDTTSQIMQANALLFHSRYTLKGRQEGSVYDLDLSMRSKSKTHFGKQSDSIGLKLNPAPMWDLSVNTGAAEVNFDLTKYKVRHLKITGSAGAFTIKIGQPVEQTDVSFQVGAADVTINVPKTAACRIEVNSAMSSNTFDHFDKNDDGSYQTAGYASATNKILIHFTGGISDFKVNRY
ncbi:MAG: hypothetical protein ACHQHN_04970 [Sphingobacteriales bacterium]